MGKLAQLLGLVLIGAVAFEATIRVEDLIRFGMPIWSPVRDQSDLVVRDGEGVHGRPNAQWRKWRLNNVGTRGPDVALAKPPGLFRIAVLGASETFGLYETPDQEYPRQLEDSLRQSQRGCSVNVEVINAAVPGMSLPTFTQDLELRLKKLALNAVVVYPTPAQYLDIGLPQAPRPSPEAHDDLRAVWATYPRGLEHIRNGLKTMLPAPVANWIRERDIELTRRQRPDQVPMDTLPTRRLAAFERDLRRLVGVAHQIGAVTVLMAHGTKFSPEKPVDVHLLTMWQRFYPLASGPVILAFDSAGARVTGEVARDSGSIFVDLRGALPGERDRLFADYVHFTDLGAGFVAGQLAAAIRPRLCNQ